MIGIRNNEKAMDPTNKYPQNPEAETLRGREGYRTMKTLRTNTASAEFLPSLKLRHAGEAEFCGEGVSF